MRLRPLTSTHVAPQICVLSISAICFLSATDVSCTASHSRVLSPICYFLFPLRGSANINTGDVKTQNHPATLLLKFIFEMEIYKLLKEQNSKYNK